MMKLFLIAGCLLLPQADIPNAPSPRPTVYQAGGEVTSPKLVYSVDPDITAEASKKRVQGRTKLSLVVNAEGAPQDIQVLQSAAEDNPPKYGKIAHDLDGKAVEAVKQYRFKPGTLKGKPVAVAITVEVNFQLF